MNSASPSLEAAFTSVHQAVIKLDLQTAHTLRLAAARGPGRTVGGAIVLVS